MTIDLQRCSIAEFATWLQLNGLTWRIKRIEGGTGEQRAGALVELVSADERTAWPGVGSNWLEALQKAIDFWASPVGEAQRPS